MWPMRRLFVWLVALPLAVGAAQAAHEFDYRLVVPDAHERAHLLAATGHEYFSAYPLLAAAALAALVLGLAGRIAGGGASTARWPFAALPFGVFALQEPLERALHSGALDLSSFAEPTFAVGLALQIPFAALAWALARLLLQAADAVAAVLRRSPPRSYGAAAPLLLPASVHLPRRAPLACALAGRGPPPLPTP